MALLAVPAAAQAITVSGTAYNDGSTTTVWTGCDGATNRIGLAVNGALVGTTTCATATGAFSFSGVTPSAANQVLTVWFDGHATRAATYTRNLDTTTNITGLQLIRSSVVIGSENANPISNADLGLWDSLNDADVPLTVAAGNVLTVVGGSTRLHVNAGDTYAPGANTTAGTVRVEGTYLGGAETLTMTGGGGSGCTTTSTSTMRSLCMGGSGTFTAPATVVYSTVSSTIFPDTVTFNTLQLRPASGAPTYSMTNGSADAVTIGTLDIGTGGAAMTASVKYGTVTVTGTTTVNASATFAPSTDSDVEVRGNFTGGGAVFSDDGSDVVLAAGSGSTVQFGSTAGSATWQFQTITLANSGAATATVRAAAGGTGPIKVLDTIYVGRSGDAGRTTVDLETNDRVLDVDTFFDLQPMGTFLASSTAVFTVGKDFDTDVGSVFTPNTGTVTFDSADKVTRITLGATVTFFNLVATTPAKVLRFDPAYQTNVSNLTLNGGACGTRVGLASNVEGTRFKLNVTGTASVQFADVIDSEAVVARAATNSTNGGNNLNWTISGSCGTVTVAGTAYENEAGAIWSGCDGVTPNIAMSVNGYGKRTTTCSAATGAYTFTPVPDPGLLIAVFMDVGTARPGVTYTLAPAAVSNLAGLDVTNEIARLRSETASPMTSSLMAMYESEADASIPIGVTEFTNYVDGPNDPELQVEAGDTFQPEGSVEVGALDIRGTYHLTTSSQLVILNSGGTNTNCSAGPDVQMPVCVSPGGAIQTDGGNGEFQLRSNAPYYVQATTYPNLVIEPTGSNPSITLGEAPGRTFTVEGGLELSSTGANAAVVNTATFSPQLNLLGGISNVGELDVELGQLLTGTSSILVTADILDFGSIDMTGGTIEQRVSGPVTTGPEGAGNHIYNDLVLSNSSASPQAITYHAASAGTVRVRGTLQVGRATDSATTTLANGPVNESIDVDGSVLVTSNGVLAAAAAPATPFTIGDDLVDQGTFTPSGGTVTFDDASRISSISTSTPATFSNLASTTPNETLRFTSGMTTTVTGTLTANGGSCGSPVTLEATTGGSAWTANIGTSAVQYATLRDSTAAPGRTATTSGNLGGNTGWTFSGGCPAPTTMLSHDTNASGAGVPQNTSILVDTPHFSWLNNSGLAADRQRFQVVTTPVDSTVVALWPLDGTGADLAGGGGGVLAGAGAPNDSSWDASAVQPGFGQSVDVDGDDVALAPAASAALDLDSFTVEAWIRLDGLTGPVGGDNLVVGKQLAADDTNFRLGVRRTAAGVGVVTGDVSTGGAGVSLPAALVGTTNLNDGRWHHLAYAVNSAPADPGKVQSVYVDGALEATGTFSGNVDNPATAVSVGGTSTLTEFVDGRVDDVRISSVPRSAAELRGAVRTRLPHGAAVWDSDPTDAGIAMSSCANLARCADAPYAGPPLVRDGARYYARGKLRSTTSIWSGWSTWDLFGTQSGLTVSVTTGAAATLTPVAQPGVDVTATSSVDVWTNDRNGYTLTATGPDDAWGMDGPGAAVLPRWSGAPALPTTWAPGVSGAFGLTVLSASGGKDTAAWGAGSTRTDFTNLRYVGLQLNTPAVLHRRNSYSAATDSIVTSYRANVAANQQAGVYNASVTYTAIPNV
ncbi:MAG: Por secretion system C-terminal sorting protein [Thermoleophilia bacterium]|nr:Por secretion system C-terminal sorting protein [Thermoleophilia bacterium]